MSPGTRTGVTSISGHGGMRQFFSWSIALFEYMLQVPAGRIGHTRFSPGQLKIMQDVIALPVFVPFAAFCMDEALKLDYLWAALCMLGAAYLIFR